MILELSIGRSEFLARLLSLELLVEERAGADDVVVDIADVEEPVPRYDTSSVSSSSLSLRFRRRPILDCSISLLGCHFSLLRYDRDASPLSTIALLDCVHSLLRCGVSVLCGSQKKSVTTGYGPVKMRGTCRISSRTNERGTAHTAAEKNAENSIFAR